MRWHNKFTPLIPASAGIQNPFPSGSPLSRGRAELSTARLSSFAVLVEIADLDAVPVGVMEIGVAAREAAVVLVGIFHQPDAARPDDLHRAVELVLLDQERMMVRVLVRIVRIDVMRNLGEHEIGSAAFHEGIALVRADEPAAQE